MLKELKTILSGDNPIVMLKIFYKLEEIKRKLVLLVKLLDYEKEGMLTREESRRLYWESFNK